MLCDVGTCGRDAVVLVRFHNVDKPYPYCDYHGTRDGSAMKRFGRYEGSGNARRWVTAVRHAQYTSPTRSNR